jgi:hypothetical protein
LPLLFSSCLMMRDSGVWLILLEIELTTRAQRLRFLFYFSFDDTFSIEPRGASEASYLFVYYIFTFLFPLLARPWEEGVSVSPVPHWWWILHFVSIYPHFAFLLVHILEIPSFCHFNFFFPTQRRDGHRGGRRLKLYTLNAFCIDKRISSGHYYSLGNSAIRFQELWRRCWH